MSSSGIGEAAGGANLAIAALLRALISSSSSVVVVMSDVDATERDVVDGAIGGWAGESIGEVD